VRLAAALLFTAAAATVASCSSPLEPVRYDARGRGPGVLEFLGDPAQVIARSPGHLGDPIVLRIRQYSGGCSTPAEIETSVDGLHADVWVYEIDATRKAENPAGACTTELLIDDREVAVPFQRRGRTTITVHGQRVLRDGPNEPMTVEVVAEVI
jgi:hypothetical protein